MLVKKWEKVADYNQQIVKQVDFFELWFLIINSLKKKIFYFYTCKLY